MSNALAVYEDGGFDIMQRSAKAMAASGYFQDAKEVAQAVVKVMAGAELGLPPFASMTGIHVIQGKPALGANLIASLIKSHPAYNYRVIELSDTVCRIQFYENGEPSGVSEFTAQDAQRAQVKNMNKYPKNMLFARAISNGARWHCPDIFGGAPVYTGEELGADFDEDGYIESVAYEVSPPTTRKAAEQSGEWYDNAPADKRAFVVLIQDNLPRYATNAKAAGGAVKKLLEASGADFDQLTASERSALAQRVAAYATMRDNGADADVALSAATAKTNTAPPLLDSVEFGLPVYE